MAESFMEYLKRRLIRSALTPHNHTEPVDMTTHDTMLAKHLADGYELNRKRRMLEATESFTVHSGYGDVLATWKPPSPAPAPTSIITHRRPIKLKAKHRVDINDVLARTRVECDRMFIIDEVYEFMNASQTGEGF